MHYLNESHILLFLVQVSILLGLARGFGELLRRLKQPALTAELLIGVVLGPTVLGRVLPGLHSALFPADAVQQAMLDTVGWIGVLFLLLDTGLEIDFSIAWRQRGSALLIALSDIVIPIIVAFVCVVWLPSHYMVDPNERLVFSLFMAAVMTISAMPVASRVLHDLKLLKTELGFLVMSALAVNDIIGWVLFTIILGVFTSQSAGLGSISAVFGVTIGFSALALTLGRRLSTGLFAWVRGMKLPEPSTSLTITVLLGLIFGAFTQKVGIHALFGFFIAGVVVGEAKSLSEQTRGVISQMVHSLFVPLFFANIGLKVDFAGSLDVFLVALMCAVGIGGRYLGAWIGVTLTKVPRVNRDLISIAHTPGGMMEIVMAVLALEAGLIIPHVFVAIVISALVSSVIMGPWMARSLARRAAVAPAAFLSPVAVVADLEAATRAEAIAELGARLAAQLGTGTPQRITEEAMARESEYGTAIGSGVAIPHVRLEGLQYPVLAYGRSVDGIEWNAPDGQEVHNVFLLVTPSSTADLHVQILSAIARAMESPANRDQLISAADADLLRQRLSAMLSAEMPRRGPKRTIGSDGE